MILRSYNAVLEITISPTLSVNFDARSIENDVPIIHIETGRVTSKHNTIIFFNKLHFLQKCFFPFKLYHFWYFCFFLCEKEITFFTNGK